MHTAIHKVAYVFATTFVFLTNLSIGQDRLSLSQAIEVGLQNNFSVQIEKQKQIQAANLNTWGQAGMFPSINLNVSPRLNFSDTDNPLTFFPGSTTNLNAAPSLDLNWVLFDGFRIKMTKHRLDLLQDQSNGNALIVIENTVQSIILAYYTVMLEESRTDVFRNSLNLSRDRFNYVKLKGDLGSAVTFDILRDKSSYLTDSSIYMIQLLNQKNAVRNLNRLLGRNVNQIYFFTDSLKAEIQDFNLDELNAAMKASNSNLKNQYVTQEILRKDIGISESALYPRISFNASGIKSWNRLNFSEPRTDSQGNIFDHVKSSSVSVLANITLSFTLFNGGQIKNQIKNTKIQEYIGQLQIKDITLTLSNTMISEFDRYNLRKNLMGIAAENLNTSVLNLSLGEERYRNGSLNSFNYRDLQITYLQTALSYYQSIYNLIESKTELLRLTGGIMSEN